MQLQFDASTVKPLGEYEVFPEGWYRMFIRASEAKETQKKDGQFLKFGFEIIDGDFKGCATDTNLNLWNKNEKAREIAFRELSTICHATGVMQLQDTSQLHHIPMWVRLAIREGNLKDDNTGYYPDQNEIKSYKNINEVVPASPTKADQIAMLDRFAKRDAERKSASPAAGGQAQAGWQPPGAQGGWQPPAQQQAPVQQPPAAQAPAPVQQQPAPTQAPAAQAAPPWAQQQVPNGQQAAANIAPPAQAPAQQAAPAQQTAAPTGVPPWAQQSGNGAPPWAQQPQG